jgi:hypothetical protein
LQARGNEAAESNELAECVVYELAVFVNGHKRVGFASLSDFLVQDDVFE